MRPPGYAVSYTDLDVYKRQRASSANDNFLITVLLSSSFPLLFTVWFAGTKEADIMPKRRANGEGNIRKRKDGRWERCV